MSTKSVDPSFFWLHMYQYIGIELPTKTAKKTRLPKAFLTNFIGSCAAISKF